MALRIPGLARSWLRCTELERRDVPAVPIGLQGVVPLPTWAIRNDHPAPYSETHDIIRSDTTTVTVDQLGSGSSGTFVIDVVGSASASDTADGGGTEAGKYVVTSGMGSNQVSYTLHQSGTYAYGAFTVTSETYSENGSHSVSFGAYGINALGISYQGDATNSGCYSLSWSAVADGNGELAYTAYAYSATDSSYYHMHTTDSNGAYRELTGNLSSWVTTTGSGVTATYNGEDSGDYHLITGPPPNDSETFDSWTNPVSGTTTLPEFGSAYFSEWRAGTPDATNFSFHGVAVSTADLTETASYSIQESDDSDLQFDVNAFASTTHASGSGHVIEDEPSIPESGYGTENYHRNELVTYDDVVTGSGSYVDDHADADYHFVKTGTFAVHNTLSISGDETTGVDDDGVPYDLVFNYTSDQTGGGSGSNVNDYHDGDAGIELTGASFSMSAGTTTAFHNWGVRNGIGFDETDLGGETAGVSLSLPGDSTPISDSDLSKVYPLVGRELGAPPVEYSYIQFPKYLKPVGKALLHHAPQEWYNHEVERIGKLAEKKVVQTIVCKPTLMQEIEDTKGNSHFPKPSGQISSPGLGQCTAFGLPDFPDGKTADRKLEETIAKEIKYMKGQQNYIDVKLVSADFVADYAFDQWNQNPRSGKVVLSYRIGLTFSAKNKNNVPIAPVRDGIQGVFLVEHDKFKTMDLSP